jgi:hypothetical protein
MILLVTVEFKPVLQKPAQAFACHSASAGEFGRQILRLELVNHTVAKIPIAAISKFTVETVK